MSDLDAADPELDAMVAALVGPEATAALDALIDEIISPEATAALDAMVAEMLVSFELPSDCDHE